MIERFTQLNVWQLAHSLALDVYKFTATLPNEEKYGIVSQMRRAAVSVPANIAEGFKRRGRNLESLNDRIDVVGKMLSKLIQSVKS